MKRVSIKAGGPKKKAATKKVGRPTKRTPAVVKRILEGLANGTPLTLLCDDVKMPNCDAVRCWMNSDPEFSSAIARAREAGFDRIAATALELSDGAMNHAHGMPGTGEAGARVMAVKLAVETRLKLLAKWDPKRYGDKITQEISGPDGGPIQSVTEAKRTAEEEAAFALMLAKADQAARPPMP